MANNIQLAFYVDEFDYQVVLALKDNHDCFIGDILREGLMKIYKEHLSNELEIPTKRKVKKL